MVQEMRLVLRNYGKVDPNSVDSYIAVGGYEALKKAKTMTPADLIAMVKDANLRGRGGAGFNCGLKWNFALKAEADQKYVVCNADEGEPGTYKDRLIMENDPHSLIEGMAIAGFAIGATKGFIYCRGEYPHVVELLRKAIAQAEEKGVLDGFKLEVRMGAGAYVCGEETALIESIEGKIGEPRFKPPYPPSIGLWGKPTIVNNVETLVNVPQIIENGADWFKSIGASNYPGTKVFTLTGDIAEKKFVEVPTNVTIKDVLELGGGVAGGKGLKAIQIGGTSGAFIPACQIDTLVDFDSMGNIGAALGSGAFFVIDETRDIVDVVKCIARFFEHESCGKCTPCREGTMRIYTLMKKINEGSGTQEDIALIEELADVMAVACLCGLGQAAPSPVVSTIKHFRADYDAKVG